jgi:hypothetical protein
MGLNPGYLFKSFSLYITVKCIFNVPTHQNGKLKKHQTRTGETKLVQPRSTLNILVIFYWNFFIKKIPVKNDQYIQGTPWVQHTLF